MARSLLLILGVLGLASGVGAAPAPKPPVVTILGDSITAGYGLPEADAAPVQLKAALKAIGVDAEVRGAGVSGDTTAGGLARVDFSVQPDTNVCVIELGANDFLQSVDPKIMEANLTAIVRRLKARRIRVVIAAGVTSRMGSGAYGRSFDAVFPAVAHREKVAIAADLFAGVEDNPAFKQGDGLHPNAAGVKIIVGRLAKVVAHVIKAKT